MANEKPSSTQPEENFERETYYTFKKQTRVDFDKHESVNELFFDGEEISKKNSIAWNTTVDKKNLIAKDVYAKIGDYKELNIKKQQMTNERVKIELIKQYLEDPRKHTAEIITTMLDSVSQHYHLSDEEKEHFQELGEEGQENRRKILEMIRIRQDDGDKKVIKSLEACDTLLKTLNATEISQKKTLPSQLEQKLDDIINYECFELPMGNKIADKLSKQERFELYDVAISKFPAFDESAYKNEIEKKRALEKWERESKNFETEKNEKLADKIRPAYENEDGEISQNINKKLNIFKENTAKMEKLKEKIDNSIGLANHITKDSKSSKNFVKLYELFASLSSANEIKNESQKASVIFRIKKDFKDLKEAEGENGLLGNIEKYIQQENSKDSSLNFNKLTSLSSKDTIPSQEYVEQMRQASLEYTILDAVKGVEDNNVRVLVAKSLKEAGEQIVKEKAKIKNGEPMKWGKVVGIYNASQENMIKGVIEKAVKDADLDSFSKSQLIDTITSSKHVSFYPQAEDGLVSDIVDTMNAHNVLTNSKIADSISKDEVHGVMEQSFRNSALKGAVKDTFNEKKEKKTANQNQRRNDISHNERVRDISTIYHSNYATKLMGSSILKLTHSRETFNSFASCVKGASVTKNSMETKLSNTSGCLDKFKTAVKKDADDLARVISQSAQGLGAINPFIHLAQIVQIYKRLSARELERNMEKIADSINGVAREVATGNTEIERRARGAILSAKADGNINVQTVHKEDTSQLAKKLKQEYVSRELVDFGERKDSSDLDTLTILQNMGIEYEEENALAPFQKSEKPNIDADLSKVFDTTIEDRKNKEEISALKNANDEQIDSDEEKNDIEKNILSNASVLANEEIKAHQLNIKDSRIAREDTNSIKKVQYKDYSTHMIESALKKIDLAQQKIAEMSLARDENGKPLLTQDEVNNGKKGVKVNHENMGFYQANAEESFEYWKIENNIENEFLEKSIEKGYDALEREKLTLVQDLIAKSVEVEKEVLEIKERNLLKITEAINDIEKKGYSYENNQLDKDDIDYVEKALETLDLKNQSLSNYSDLTDMKQKIIDDVNNSPRPREKLEKLAKEIRGLFDGKNDLSKLQKRNILSEAMNILSQTSNSYKKMNTIFETSSMAVDVLSQEGNDMDVLGIADKAKAYILKTHKIISEKINDFSTKEEQNYNDLISLNSDSHLLDSTKAKNNETSLSSWSDFMEGNLNFNNNNDSVRTANQARTQVNNSSIDAEKEVGDYTPDMNRY